MKANNTHTKILPFKQSAHFYFRIGERYLNNNDYINALNFYKKAAEKDPSNPDYKLILAEILTEMDYYEQSNKILYYMITKSNTDKAAECYYGMGCNFLGLQEYEKAQKYFYKYLDLEPDGLYYDEVSDLLDIIETQDVLLEETRKIDENSIQLYELITEGKKQLEGGNYKKAIKSLKRAISIDDSITHVKNNLSLAYFYISDFSKALELAENILKKEPWNIHANCNLAVYYDSIGDKQESEKYIEKIEQCLYKDMDKLYKIATTMCQLKLHNKANKALRKLLRYKPYDINVLHYLGISYLNLKEYKNAAKCWGKIIKIKEHDSVAWFYYNHVKENDDLVDSNEYNYQYQVPEQEFIRRIKVINEVFTLRLDELRERWKWDEDLRDVLMWTLDLYDDNLKIAVLNLMSNLKDKEIEKIYKDFVQRHDEKDELIKETLRLLKEMGANEPYTAHVKGELVEVTVDVLPYIESGKSNASFLSVDRITIEFMKKRYKKIDEDLIIKIWRSVLHSYAGDEIPRIKNMNGWSAALEYYYCDMKGIAKTQKELSRIYDVSISTISINYRNITMKVDRRDDKNWWK